MNIAILKVPMWYGCDQLGVEEAPNKLFCAGIKKIFEEDGHHITVVKTIDVPKIDVQDKYQKDSSMKYLTPIISVNNELATSISTVIRNRAIPITIGGDHSIGLGSVAGSAACYDNFCVVWLDAHGDMNTNQTSPTGNIHGMPLATLMGRGDKRLQSVNHSSQSVIPENVILLGARSLDIGELKLIATSHIKHISSAMIRSNGIHKTIDEVVGYFAEHCVKNIHLSIDVDVLDPEFAPGTGVKEKEGLNVDEVLGLIKGLLATQKVKALDVVEYNYRLDKEDITLCNTLKIIQCISKNL